MLQFLFPRRLHPTSSLRPRLTQRLRITTTTTPRPNFQSQFQSQSIPFKEHYRNIMSSAPAKKEFLCILPDKPGVLEKRLEVRGSHIEGAVKHSKEGSVVLGGAMFNEHPKEGETPSFKGSALMVVAEDEQQVRRLLEEDVYSKNGVWDLENTQIIPFKSAVRNGL